MPVIFTKVEKALQDAASADAAKEVLRRENDLLRRQLMEAQSKQQKNETHLVVNGQVRKIGKKSHYLLDMLTLPEDK